MKKFIGLVICFVLIVIGILPAFAVTVDGKDYGMGMIPESWEDIIDDESENTYSAFATLRIGDVNADGRISAIDARQCLQIVAENQTYIDVKQKKTADMNGDGMISALDARKILQVASGLTTMDTVVTTDLNWGIIIGPLQTAGSGNYFWEYEINADGLRVAEKNFAVSGETDSSINQYFIFTPEKAGIYTINLKYANAEGTEILDEFNVILTVTE